MKKLIALLAVFAIVLSLCACGGDPANNTETSAATDASEDVSATEATEGGGQRVDLSPEALYGHINQMEPTGGVYMIWNKDGVKNMSNHPEGNFKILCNIDMQGEAITPIGSASKPFTGTIDGGNFILSNVAITGSNEGEFGFVGYNKGEIKNVVMEYVTLTPDASAKNIGALAGTNEGDISFCTLTFGTMVVENAADNATCGGVAGINSGDMFNTSVEVDTDYLASGAANVGGIVGITTGGTLETVNNKGKLDVTGTNKTVGLYAGTAKDTTMTSCGFLGESNTVDGVLFTNYNGTEENCSLTKCVWRDNEKPVLSEASQKLRDTVVEYMEEMVTIQWYVSEERTHDCSCSLARCHGTFTPGITYVGINYGHKESSLARFKYMLDENNYLKDFVYDMDPFEGLDLYMGNDCSGAVMHAWWTVSNSVDFWGTSQMMPTWNRGTIPVGDWIWDFDLTSSDTMQVIDVNGEERMYEAYAQVRKGDAFAYYVSDAGNGHTMIASEDAVVVRDMEGKVDPFYSYVLVHEQGGGVVEEGVYADCNANAVKLFAGLRNYGGFPITCEELLTGEMEPIECKIIDGGEGKLALTTGIVKANYFLDAVTLKLTDSKGEVVMDKIMWATVGKRGDTGSTYSLTRAYNDEFDMASFAVPLQQLQLVPGETYSYSIEVLLGTEDVITVGEGSFVNGAGTAQ